MADPRITTIPAGQAFLPALARAILAGDLPRAGGAPPSPIALSKMTLLMPTRRAARALGEAFLDAAGGRALLLPRIQPIAETDDDLALMTPTDGYGGATDTPPKISDIERRLVLTQMVLQWSAALRGDASSDEGAAGASTPAQAVHLAAELAHLMDMVETEGVSLAGLAGLVPEDYSAHWDQTLQFLKIVIEAWPAFLAAAGKLAPADHRNRTLLAEAARLSRLPPADPVIVAGVTGSIPATTALMRQVLALPQGAIVLPGLDLALDADSAAAIAAHHPEHPQFGLMRLLAALDVPLADVGALAGSALDARAAARARLVGEAMRPSETLHEWQHVVAAFQPAELQTARDGLSVIDAASADEEAEAVALILREAAETPGRTASLVSPDRRLARRVVARLATMGLAVDDSAGRPLAKTPPGAFLDLVAEAWSSAFAPVATMALLKHPLLRLGMSVRDVRRAARALELNVFRGLYLGRGLDGVTRALDAADADVIAGKRQGRAKGRLRDEDKAAARALVNALATAYAPLTAIADDEQTHSLKIFLKAHADVAEALSKEAVADDAATTDAATVTETTTETAVQEASAAPLWQGEAGENAHRFFTEILDDGIPAPAIAAADYPDVYRSLVSTINVRPRLPAHPRIAIWGPFEARLQQPDVVILGGLVDGVWPASADPGPWLSRPMRASLGLPSPEAAIGQAAHDFVTLMGARQVYLTRAAKVGGVPTVPSRWRLRLDALLDGAKPKTGKSALALLAPQEPWLAWARHRDTAPKTAPIAAPAPCPPLAWRPRKLPVTAIERWIANPYSIYAQHILRLDPIDPIGGEPGAALRGQIVHDALHGFAQRFPTALPDDIAHELLEEARRAMEAYAAHPRVAAFWRNRFERFAHWFAETEPERRAGITKTIAEVEGDMLFDAPGGAFKLRARADRIDVAESSLVITDYKTGRAPTDKRVIEGLSPQLPLEAAIAAAGGFTGLGGKTVAKLAYIRVSGGEPPGEHRFVGVDDAAALAERIKSEVARLIAEFDRPETPYRAVRRAAYAESYDYDAYAHLARAPEWSDGQDEEGS